MDLIYLCQFGNDHFSSYYSFGLQQQIIHTSLIWNDSQNSCQVRVNSSCISYVAKCDVVQVNLKSMLPAVFSTDLWAGPRGFPYHMLACEL